eukprot:scaffold128523_cov27-Tisochrysis_lutea.AAC.1
MSTPMKGRWSASPSPRTERPRWRGIGKSTEGQYLVGASTFLPSGPLDSSSSEAIAIREKAATRRRWPATTI